MPTKQSVTLTFQDPAGNPLAGGKVVFKLSSDVATAVSGGVQITAKRAVSSTLDSSGSTTVLLWPNGVLLPAGTVYFVTAYTAQGQPAWSGEMNIT